MRRRRDKMLPKDLKVWSQDYPDHKSAVHEAKLVSKVACNSKIHVRKNIVVVRTVFSADSWAMTFITLLTMLSKCNIPHPELVWKYANECVKFCRKHKTWYLKNQDGSRVSCGEFIDSWKGILPLNN